MTPASAPSPPPSPPPAPPASLPVRVLTLADLTACLDLAAEHGWAREEHKWRLLLTAGRGVGIDAPDRPGTLLATLVLTSYGETHRCIGMVLVAARFARRGVGRHLMRHALDSCGGAAVFLTATANGRPLYERLGFAPVGTVTTLRGTFTGAAPAPAPAGTVLRAATAADIPAILAYDRPVFGADRTELLTRLPAFADQILVAHAPGGRLTGYAAAWPNETTTVIGPALADDQPTARALVARLAAAAPMPVRFDVDPRHPGLADWLRANGLTGDYVCTLMVRGAPDLPGDIDRRFAPLSVALG
ncbi:GNAT family N-acetyltransferase [Streptomyces johnsoniae]|uniref:GNAT family N-acetyltransferase n=1 Tax=Streptomyces johnsoniae TaxID=3075532 RepID=A0ABU2SD63_9ACTN|nr:GNAT family N-acetyltransferase [Streptomyces sp. DSM 41886]MDT0446015.1 GNAT family N-acetyltransferase [Streptomyces sp. DSM 41886]